MKPKRNSIYSWTVGTLAAGLLALLLQGCGAAGLSQGFAKSEGGLPLRNSASFSDRVDQARKGRLDAAGARIPYSTRKLDEKLGPRTFVLALEGQGTTQQGRKLPVRVELDKTTYADGQVLLGSGSSAQVWPIVASDRRGTLTEFDYIYLLARPGEGYRYLQLIGGGYRTEAGRFFGITGMILEPEQGNDARQISAVTIVNFGHEFPETPRYAQHISEVSDLLRTLRSSTRALISLEEDIQEQEREIAELRAQTVPPGGAQARQTELNALDVELAALRTRRKDLATEADASWMELFALRRQIEESYAVFVETNRYRWFPRGQQEDRFGTWERTYALDKDIEAAFATYIPHSSGRAELENERKETLDAVNSIDNKARNPKAQG